MSAWYQLTGRSTTTKVCAASLANAAAFAQAVEDVAAVARTLIDSLSTTAPPRDREIEADKARTNARRRFPK